MSTIPPLKSPKHWDFPGGPVGKTPRSQCRGSGFNPWSGNQIPHAQVRVCMLQLKILHAATKTRHSRREGGREGGKPLFKKKPKTKKHLSIMNKAKGPRGSQSWPFSTCPPPTGIIIIYIQEGGCALPRSPGLRFLPYTCARVTMHADSFSSSRHPAANTLSRGRKAAHQAHKEGAQCLLASLRGSDSLRVFHIPPVSLPVISPPVMELGVGTEFSEPESVKCSSLRRSRRESVYTCWEIGRAHV